MIAIRDDGRGMTSEELAQAVGAGEGQGNGLGIRLSRQLIEAHGGTLEIESRKGVGTVAAIILP